MKIFFTAIIVCLCTINMYAQTTYRIIPAGNYIFSSATVSISDLNTEQEVESYIINDIATADTLNSHFMLLMREVNVYNNRLINCILFDNKEYVVTENDFLVPFDIFAEYDEQLLDDETMMNKIMYLYPHTLTFNNNKLTVNIRYPFGDSRYDFMLRANLTIILTSKRK